MDLEIRADRVNATRWGILGHGKLLYEVSYDGGVTWDYWGELYGAESGSKEHMGSTIIRVLDDDTVLSVDHRGTKEFSVDHGSGARVIGATWLRRVQREGTQRVRRD